MTNEEYRAEMARIDEAETDGTLTTDEARDAREVAAEEWLETPELAQAPHRQRRRDV